MAKLMFSLSGEGRGHATRVRAVIEELRVKHQITIFAPGDACDFLAPLYRDSAVRVQPIPGLRFHYDEARRLDLARTARGAAAYLKNFSRLRGELERELTEGGADLVITDFEPALPRAARRLGIPFISLSHQHFLLAYDLSSLPFHLRAHAFYMGRIVRAYYSGEVHSIISSFYFPPLREGCRDVTQIGVLLRPEIRAARPERRGHMVAYLRKFCGPNVLEALKSIGAQVRVYGLGEQPSAANLIFKAISEAEFLEDLATSNGLIATAGNQLVGEALYLGKPCFLMPEARNYEQYMNAHFLEESGGGAWLDLEKVTPSVLQHFTSHLERYRSQIDSARLDGLPSTLEVISRFLPKADAAGTHRSSSIPELVL